MTTVEALELTRLVTTWNGNGIFSGEIHGHVSHEEEQKHIFYLQPHTSTGRHALKLNITPIITHHLASQPGLRAYH